MRLQIAVHLSGDQIQLPVRNSLSIPHGGESDLLGRVQHMAPESLEELNH